MPGAEMVYRPSLSGLGNPGFAAADATAAMAPKVRIWKRMISQARFLKYPRKNYP